MNRPAILKAAYFAVLAIGEDPTQRSMQAMTKRICGKAFQTKDVLEFLATHRPSSKNVADPTPHSVAEITHENAPPSSTPVAGSVAPHGRVVKVLESEEYEESPETSSPPTLLEADVLDAKPKPDSKAKAKPKVARPPYVPAPFPDDLPARIPSGDPDALRAMARAFVAEFANAGPDKAAKYLDAYASALAKAASRRRTTEEAWSAFGTARLIQGGRPLFACWGALDHLPFRPSNDPMPGDQPTDLNASDRLPTLSDLIAAGKVAHLDSAAIVASRPAWFNALLAEAS